MMSWMAERDRLLAQTRAFVREVAAAHPKTAQDLLSEALPPGPPRSDAGVVHLPPLNAAPAAPAAPTVSEAAPPPSSPSVRPVVQEKVAVEANVPTGWPSNGGESDRPLERALDVSRADVKAPPPDTILVIPRIASSERDDIAIRVAHFREHQRRLNREREAYSEQMRARIRSVLGNGGSAA